MGDRQIGHVGATDAQRRSDVDCAVAAWGRGGERARGGGVGPGGATGGRPSAIPAAAVSRAPAAALPRPASLRPDQRHACPHKGHGVLQRAQQLITHCGVRCAARTASVTGGSPLYATPWCARTYTCAHCSICCLSSA